MCINPAGKGGTAVFSHNISATLFLFICEILYSIFAAVIILLINWSFILEIITFTGGPGNNVEEAVVINGGATLSEILEAEIDYLLAMHRIKDHQIKTIDMYFFSVGSYIYNELILSTKNGFLSPVIFKINISSAQIDKEAAEYISQHHSYLIN